MVPFSFAGREFCALAEGALFWPARSALLVADLHFEKASWFAGTGQMLPPYDSIATLSALVSLKERLNAREIWCLGDSFHDHDGPSRLNAPARNALDRLENDCRLIWITGNHDPLSPSQLNGAIMDEADIDGIVLRHQALPLESRPELSGHFHPKLRLRIRGNFVSRRCFVMTKSKIILPAFGAFTGGLDAAHPEILRAAGDTAQALVPLDSVLLRFPLAA